MYSVSWGAVRWRVGQTVTVLVLTALAVAAAAGVSWYLLPIASDAAAARVAAAPADRRVIQVHHIDELSGRDPRAAIDAWDDRLRGLLPLPGARPWLGLVQDTTYRDPRPGGTAAGLPVAYRDDFCGHARITGSCPRAAGEAVLGRFTAGRLGLAAGDRIELRSSAAPGPVTIRVTGVYDPADPDGPYWTDPEFRAKGDLEPAFTTLDTFGAAQLGKPQFAYDVAVPAALLRGDGGFDFNAVLNAATPRIAAAQLELSNPAGPLATAIGADRDAVAVAVLTQAGQVLVLAWLALGLAGRFTGRDRGADAGLLLLRGSTRGRLLRLAAGQHLPALLGGALLGWPLGVLAARLLAGRWPLRAELWPALWWSLTAVAAVLAVGLLILAVVDIVAQRAPVATLLRRVPSMRRDWRSAVADALLVALAAGAAYQARAAGSGSGLGLVAPALVALAAGVLIARVLRAVADRAGAAAIKAGRLRAGLTAVQISRRPDADRVFALIVVAVAMLALTVGGWSAGDRQRAVRAEVELGATRVLTVRAESRTHLLDAVRRADPGGRHAMAAALDTDNGLLAVDTGRLAAVARWRPDYGPVTALATAAPRRLPLITGTALSLRVDSDRTDVTRMILVVQHEATGRTTEVQFRGVRPGARTVTVPVAGCTAAPGCRLVSIQLVVPFVAGSDGARPVPGGVVVRGLDQRGPDATVLDGARLADVSYWRTDFAGLALQATTTGAGLSMAPQDGRGDIGQKVYALDTPLPLPLVVAGAQPADWRLQDATLDIFAQAETPVRVVAATAALPVLGGKGTMADLDSVARLVVDSRRPAAFQVWLSADAPASVRAALTREGLAITGEQSTARRAADLAHQRDAVTTPFQLYGAVLGLLLAAAMLAAAATVERGPLTEQLRALRVQGLSGRTAVVLRFAGTTWLAGTGLLAGLLAAMIARTAAAVTAPPFLDGWQVIPPPGALGPLAVGLAALAGLAVLVPTVWLSSRGAVR
jgi:putative ABC transport system permease protein